MLDDVSSRVFSALVEKDEDILELNELLVTPPGVNVLAVVLVVDVETSVARLLVEAVFLPTITVFSSQVRMSRNGEFI